MGTGVGAGVGVAHTCTSSQQSPYPSHASSYQLDLSLDCEPQESTNVELVAGRATNIASPWKKSRIFMFCRRG